MKASTSLEKAQKEMRQRQRNPRPAGRPPLALPGSELLELWSNGYSPRGMAIHFGCDERTVRRRLSEIFGEKEPTLSTSPDALLYSLAMNSDNPKFIIAFMRRVIRREKRSPGRHWGSRRRQIEKARELQGLLRELRQYCARNRSGK